MRVVFLPKYSQLGGSSRHMIYSYLEFYEQAGIACQVAPLFDDYYFSFRVLSQPARFTEIAAHANYFLVRAIDRLRWLMQASRFDVVVVEREVLPYLPFGLELLLKKFQPRLVSLYDDAVHASYQYHPWRVVRWLCRDKIQKVMAISRKVIVWNQWLADYACHYNPNVMVVNTGIDLRRYRVKQEHDRNDTGQIIIGWIGTPNSFPYLAGLEDVFARLSARYSVELRIVSSMDYHSDNIKVRNRRWSLETEVDDLCLFDIGIMPLADDEQARGKSGYKAVQYMGVGIPAVCSPVGVNTEIIQDGVNGFLARTPDEWFEKLSCLIQDAGLRRRQGLAGRKLMESKYSIQAVAPRLVQALKDL